MTSSSIPEDPEPLDRVPAGHALFVPVRSGPAGCTARFFRTALGSRAAVAFTSEDRLRRTLGADHPFVRLAEPALRAMASPLGVTTLRIDPRLSARPATPSTPGFTHPAAIDRMAQSAPTAPALTRPAAIDRGAPTAPTAPALTRPAAIDGTAPVGTRSPAVPAVGAASRDPLFG